MNKIHKTRLTYLILFLLGLSIVAGLILYALKQNINVFLTPSELSAAKLPSHHTFRLGGQVKIDSVKRDSNSLQVQFIVTDLKKEVRVNYTGILPDLFREGKGVIALGYLDEAEVFQASEVLAKHDENYMPKNVYQQLRNNALSQETK